MIRLFFPEEEGVILDISADYSGDVHTKEPRIVLPKYIKYAENAVIICSKNEVDDESPIQIHVGNDPDICSILLLEETNYELRLIGCNGSAFDYIIAHSENMVLKESHFAGENNSRLFFLRFNSYVGKGIFDIESNGITYNIPFEVRSKKLGYLSDYPKMMADIAAYSTSLLFQIQSPLYFNYEFSTNTSTASYEDFLILDYVFHDLRIDEAYELIKNNPQYELNPRVERVPAGQSSYIDPSDLEELVYSSNIVEMNNGPIASHYTPIEISERTEDDHLDTSENRLVKDLILTMHNMVQTLKNIDDKTSYMSDRLNHMENCLMMMLKDAWLDDISELNRIPFESTVLQRRDGYRDFFLAYQLIGLGTQFKLDDVNRLLKGQNNKVHMVYEYWCYTRLHRCLYRLTEKGKNHPNELSIPLSTDRDDWNNSIKHKAIRFLVPVKDCDNNTVEIVAELLYNKQYNSSNPRFKSYSLDMRPDFTIIFRNKNVPRHTFIFNFDAKYRVDKSSYFENINLMVESGDNMSAEKTTAWASDIYKMHTYRDALLKCCGSYILYPETKQKPILFKKPVLMRIRNIVEESLFHSIGAIPLNPRSQDDEGLQNVIESILKEISSIREGEIDLEDLLD